MEAWDCLQQSEPRAPAKTITSLPILPISLTDRFLHTRLQTLALCDGLTAEDMTAQSMANASPIKWHLAHTSWFFEQFVIGGATPTSPPLWHELFNSYYQSVGKAYPRNRRGLLTRPSLSEVLEYRSRIDEQVQDVLSRRPDPELRGRIELGIQHEQQHQELMLADLKHLFSLNPLEPAYRFATQRPLSSGLRLRFLPGTSGSANIGYAGAGFAFDNEKPQHPYIVPPHRIANRPVTNAEYRTFILDGGYRRASLWLADGWNALSKGRWRAPLYWSEDLDSQFTLYGRVNIEAHAPVCHVSYFEADAFARWAGARLLTEQEWEADADSGDPPDAEHLHPVPAQNDVGLRQMHGAVWQWTASAYAAYPRFRTETGALGEYNGKFMCGQQVLRGSSCITPAGHARSTYRNFFYPQDRWQFSGIRLGVDA